MADQAHMAAREYLSLLRRQKWLIVLVLVIVPTIAVGFSLRQEKLYRATAEVLLTHQDLAAGLLRLPDPNASVDADRLAQTQATLARTPLVTERTLHAAHLRDRTAQDLLAQSEVTPHRNEDILSFAVEDRNPRLAMQLATGYARQYPRFRLELDNRAIAAARAEVGRQIRALRASSRTDPGLSGSLEKKRRELGTLGALQTTSAVLSRPADAAAQIQPRPVRKAIVGLMIGLFLGAGLALLRDTFDARVRTVEEIDERLDVPLLGELAWHGARSARAGAVTALAEPHGPQAEGFRKLRLSFEFANLDRRAVTVMVSSAVEGEGKSTTITNLAVVMAHAGKRVVVVDLDLRRPGLHKLLKTRDFPGITDVALGQSSLSSACVPVALWTPGAEAMTTEGVDDERSLELLPAGTRPPSIGEFMSSTVLGPIFEELRERADVVLIDAPPLLRVGDALALSARVDAMLLVTRLKVVTRPMLRDVSRVFARSRTPVLGVVVVTGAKPLNGHGGFGYGERTRAIGRRVRVAQ